MEDVTPIWIVTLIVTHVISFTLGYVVGGKVMDKAEPERRKVSRQIFGGIVVSVWAYRLLVSTFNTNLQLTISENVIMGLVTGATFQPSDEVLSFLHSLIGSKLDKVQDNVHNIKNLKDEK